MNGNLGGVTESNEKRDQDSSSVFCSTARTAPSQVRSEAGSRGLILPPGYMGLHPPPLWCVSGKLAGSRAARTQCFQCGKTSTELTAKHGRPGIPFLIQEVACGKYNNEILLSYQFPVGHRTKNISSLGSLSVSCSSWGKPGFGLKHFPPLPGALGSWVRTGAVGT